jgi:hypothetical protein
MTDQQIVDLLSAHTKNILNDLGKIWGLARRHQDRTDLARAIAKQMASADIVREQVAQLNDLQRTLREYIQAAGGTISTAALQRQALREKLVTPSPPLSYGYYAAAAQRKAGTFEAEIFALMQRGLVLSPGQPRYGSQYLDLNPRVELLIPAPVLAALPPLPAVDATLEGEAPSHVKPGDAGAFQRDLYLY